MDRFLDLVMLGWPERSQQPHTVVSFYRGVGKPEFEAPKVRLLRHLARHMTVVATNFWRVRALEAVWWVDAIS
jgi:hypothetical protein